MQSTTADPIIVQAYIEYEDALLASHCLHVPHGCSCYVTGSEKIVVEDDPIPEADVEVTEDVSEADVEEEGDIEKEVGEDDSEAEEEEGPTPAQVVCDMVQSREAFAREKYDALFALRDGNANVWAQSVVDAKLKRGEHYRSSVQAAFRRSVEQAEARAQADALAVAAAEALELEAEDSSTGEEDEEHEENEEHDSDSSEAVEGE